MNTDEPQKTPTPTLKERLKNVKSDRWADIGVCVSASTSFALSYESVQAQAAEYFTKWGLSYAVPLSLDGLASFAAIKYVNARRTVGGGRGWQVLTWTCVGGSLAINAAGRSTGMDQWVHAIGPAAFGAIIELYAHDAVRERKRSAPKARPIPLRLWLTSPTTTFRLWLRMARTDVLNQVQARVDDGRYHAAMEAIRTECKGVRYRRMRRISERQLRAGTLDPVDVLDVLGWSAPEAVSPANAPAAMKALLARALIGQGDRSSVTGQSDRSDVTGQMTGQVTGQVTDGMTGQDAPVGHRSSVIGQDDRSPVAGQGDRSSVTPEMTGQSDRPAVTGQVTGQVTDDRSQVSPTMTGHGASVTPITRGKQAPLPEWANALYTDYLNPVGEDGGAMSRADFWAKWQASTGKSESSLKRVIRRVEAMTDDRSVSATG